MNGRQTWKVDLPVTVFDPIAESPRGRGPFLEQALRAFGAGPYRVTGIQSKRREFADRSTRKLEQLWSNEGWGAYSI
jgi:hypothetical protein